MKKYFTSLLVGVVILILSTTVFAGTEKESTPVPPSTKAHWWEIPFQPPEKWFTPKQEDDEWYKQYQQKKYKNKGRR